MTSSVVKRALRKVLGKYSKRVKPVHTPPQKGSREVNRAAAIKISKKKGAKQERKSVKWRHHRHVVRASRRDVDRQLGELVGDALGQTHMYRV